MSCVYTYQNKTFKTRAELENFLSPVKFQAVRPKLFPVHSKNIEAIRSGEKTLSHRTPDKARMYKKGDTLIVQHAGADVGITLMVSEIHHVKDISKLPKKRRDKFATMIGDYVDFQDLVNKNPYLNVASLKAKYPEFSNFIEGNSEGYLVEYQKVESRTAQQIIDDAKTSNPAADMNRYVLEKTQVKISEQINALSKKDLKNNAFRENRLERLTEIMSILVGTEDLLAKMDLVSEDIAANLTALENILDKIDAGTYTGSVIDSLMRYRLLVSNYEFLNDIKKEIDVIKLASKVKDKDSMIYKLTKALGDLETIQNTIENRALPVIVDAIGGYTAVDSQKELEEEMVAAKVRQAEIFAEIANNPKISTKRAKRMRDSAEKRIAKIELQLKRTVTDKARLEQAIKFVSRDVGIFGQYMGAVSQSIDPVLAMYSLSVKERFEEARLDTIEVANNLQKVYDKFKKNNNSNSLAKLYKGMFEVFSSFQTGFEERLKFVEKYDMQRYYMDRKEYLANLDLVAEKARLQGVIAKIEQKSNPSKIDLQQAQNLRLIVSGTMDDMVLYLKRQFDKANMELKSEAEIESIVAEMVREKGIVGAATWAKDHMNEGAMKHHNLLSVEDAAKVNSTPGYWGELKQPIKKYRSDKWLDMYNEDGTPKNERGEMHKAFVDTYLAYQKKLPEHERQGLMLPGLTKQTSDRALELQNPKDAIISELGLLQKEYFGENFAEDIEYGSSLEFGDANQKVPVHMRNNLAPEDTSIDLFASILKFAHMANTYEARNDMLPYGMLLLDNFKKREVGEQSLSMKEWFSITAQKLGFKKQLTKPKGTSLSEQQLQTFIDMQLFGNMKKPLHLGRLRADKVLSKFKSYSSWLAFNLLFDPMAKMFMGATANAGQQITQQLIESVGTGGASIFKDGYKLVTRHFQDIFLTDFGKAGNKTLWGQIIDHYDVMQGEHVDNLANNVSGKLMRQLMNSSPFYIHRKMSEQVPQIAFFMGSMKRIKVKMGNKMIPLTEAYELVDGKLALKKGVEFTRKEELNFMGKMHAKSKAINGVYNSFDKSKMEQHAIMDTILFFRKYLYPGWRRRWASDFIDYEQDKWARGFARGYWEAMYREVYVNRNFMALMGNKGLSQREKQDLIRTYVSTGTGLMYGMIATLLQMIIESSDDEDNDVYNFLLYNAVRLQSETASFWNPNEQLRILKSPTILQTYFERMVSFGMQLGDPYAEYKRDWGGYKKGDSKLLAKWVKMTAGQTHYSENPELAVSAFTQLIK